MKDFTQIPDDIRDMVMSSKSLALWSIDENPLSDSYQIARFFQEKSWYIYPIHDYINRILEVACFRDIRLMPDDYDILLLFCNPDRLPETLNAIFNADYIPPLIWTHEGIIDLESIDRLIDSEIKNVMDYDLMDFYIYWEDRE